MEVKRKFCFTLSALDNCGQLQQGITFYNVFNGKLTEEDIVEVQKGYCKALREMGNSIPTHENCVILNMFELNI